MDNAGAAVSLIFPILYVVICVALVFGVFRAFRNLESIKQQNARLRKHLVRLHTETNQLMREILAELQARK
jgi:hypothetical protein